MKRIQAIFAGKIESIKIENKIKRVNQALEAAKTNAECKELDAQLAIDEAFEKVSSSTSVSDFINNISAAFDKKAEAQAELARIAQITAYLEEEIQESK